MFSSFAQLGSYFFFLGSHHQETLKKNSGYTNKSLKDLGFDSCDSGDSDTLPLTNRFRKDSKNVFEFCI